MLDIRLNILQIFTILRDKQIYQTQFFKIQNPKSKIQNVKYNTCNNIYHMLYYICYGYIIDVM